MTAPQTQKTKKEDLRVIKTKRSLLEAFLSLISQRHFENITVNDLCELAEVRRATFYKHYTDKYDFLANVAGALREDFDKNVWKKEIPASTREYYVEYVKCMVNYVKEHYPATENIIGSEVKYLVINAIAEKNFIDTKKRLEADVEKGLILPTDTTTVALMLVGGITQIIVCWATDGCKDSPELINSRIEALINCIIKN